MNAIGPGLIECHDSRKFPDRIPASGQLHSAAFPPPFELEYAARIAFATAFEDLLISLSGIFMHIDIDVLVLLYVLHCLGKNREV